MSNVHKIGLLNVEGDFNHRSIWQEVQQSYPVVLVGRGLEIIDLEIVQPERIRVDYGSEYIGSILSQYYEEDKSQSQL